MGEADGQTSFTTRFQLTGADARGAFWAAMGEWLPYLVGVALLTLLCATWRSIGVAAPVGTIFFPAVTLIWLLSRLNRAVRAVDPYLGKDFVLSFDAVGLRLESPLAKTEIPWTTIRGIARRRAYWFFSSKQGGRFFVPAAAIPVEARAFIGRWAGEAGARLA